MKEVCTTHANYNPFMRIAGTYHGPLGLAAADTEDKVLDDLLSLDRVGDLGVELHAVELLLNVGDGSKGRGRGVGNRLESLGHLAELVAVAHPDLGRGTKTLEQAALAVDNGHVRVAKLALVTGQDLLC